MMKLLLCMLLCLIKISTSCRKVTVNSSRNSDHDSGDNCGYILAKIVRYDCDRVILQILSHSIVGDSIWEDRSSGKTYTNVVSYHGTCEITQLTNGELTTIYINIGRSTAKTNPNCVKCAAISENIPKTNIDLHSVSKCSCIGEQ